MSVRRQSLSGAVAILAVGWMCLIVVAFRVIPLRSNYIELWTEHQGLQQRIDQGEIDPRTASGDGLADIFEYRASAGEDYLMMLESAPIVGVLPAMLLILGAAFFGRSRE